MIAETRSASSGAAGLRSDVEQVWRGVPDKAFFLGLLGAWLALFHFVGNSTFGYT